MIQRPIKGLEGKTDPCRGVAVGPGNGAPDALTTTQTGENNMQSTRKANIGLAAAGQLVVQAAGPFGIRGIGLVQMILCLRDTPELICLLFLV